MKPIMFDVHFFSNSETNVPTESYTTARELKSTVMNKLGLNNKFNHYYGLIEIVKRKDGSIEERLLDDEEKIVDITAKWIKEKQNLKLFSEDVEFKIYFKINLYFDFPDNDKDNVNMLYVQTQFDVIVGKYNLNEFDVITLGALKYYIDNGEGKEDEVELIINQKMNNFISYQFNKRNSHNYLSEKIKEKYSSFSFNNPNEAKLSFLDHLKQSPLWETHQFNVEVFYFLFSYQRNLIKRTQNYSQNI
jgi:hypothetical protein